MRCGGAVGLAATSTVLWSFETPAGGVSVQAAPGAASMLGLYVVVVVPAAQHVSQQCQCDTHIIVFPFPSRTERPTVPRDSTLETRDQATPKPRSPSCAASFPHRSPLSSE